MHLWNLGLTDPLLLTLAADERLTHPDYTNDQIWELSLGAGEPAALALYTTFGLRARSMRLFPRFFRNDVFLTNPLEFRLPPRVTRLYPNYLDLQFSPYGGIDVQSEIWLVSSQTIAGRITFRNPSVLREDFTFEWDSLLSPLGEGQGVAVTPLGIHNVLQGKTDDLHLVCFMTGGPQTGAGPYAGLSLNIDLIPGDSRQVTWAFSALPDAQAAYELARQTTARPWEAEIARIELTHASQSVEITTGDSDWDAAFMLSQRAARALFFPSSENLPHPSFVLARQPSHGFSMRGNGSDYPALWSGQTVLDSWYLAGIVLPGMADRIAGLVENFLSTQEDDGFIDWKPGLAGQRSKRLAQPLLAGLAWQVYRINPDPEWLRKVYPGLLSFFRCWLSPLHDRDQDGFPEWDHPYQPGLDDLLIFNPAQPHAQGIEPSAVEPPGLAAWLFNEAVCLQQIAALLAESEDETWLADQQSRLKAAVEQTWNQKAGTYAYRDTLMHASTPGKTLLTFSERGDFSIDQVFSTPQRLQLRLTSQTELTRRVHLLLKGKNGDLPLEEEINPRDIQWLHGVGRYTSQAHFSALDQVSILGIHPGDLGELSTVDFSLEDITLLLPLWVQIPDPERAARLIQNTILERYQQPYGLTVCPRGKVDDPCSSNEAVLLPWNRMVAEGMLAYGYRKEAALLFEGWMRAIIQSLKEDRACRAAYHPVSGQGSGERNLLAGLAPLGLFLQILGLKLLSNQRIIIDGLNPFSWPVTVQYRGTTLTFFMDNTRVTFTNGQSVTLTDDGPYEINLI